MRSIAIGHEPIKGGLKPIELVRPVPFCSPAFGFDKAAEYAKEQLKKIPTTYLRRHAAKLYAARFNSTTAKNPEKSANIFMRELIKRVDQIVTRSPLNITELQRDKRRKDKAKQLALICQQMGIVDFDKSMTLKQATALVISKYQKLAEFTINQIDTAPAYSTYETFMKKGGNPEILADKLEIAIRRMTCDKWWQRKLNRARDMTLEHLNITLGLVNKKKSPYASLQAVNEFKYAKKSQQEWLDSMQLESDDGETTLDLAEVFKGSVSNPEIRRVELMVRIRGYEEYAQEQGMKAVFYTITAPSQYHANSKKYNNATPKETQAFLVNQWAKARAELNKIDVPVFGVRVVEPHHDATPHWHMLLFMLPKHEQATTDMLEKYAMQIDGDEKGAEQARFTAENIDPSKGSAVGYIAKYISKNINAKHIEGEEDYETGNDFISENGLVLNVGAWASRWRIRQFQFVGGASVGVWREVRRLKSEMLNGASPSICEIFNAADTSQFARFISLMGGAFTKRAQRPIQISRVADGLNEYGEEKKRVVGLESCSSVLKTRLMRFALKKRSDSDAPWSTENNCNHPANDWQIGAGDRLNPIAFIPKEIRNNVLRGATYYEVDEQLKTITEFKVKNNQLTQESIGL
ncbi:putative replication initiation protein [Pseudoalteromonas phage Cr39582]|uniref:Putative replication initiation protein n=1 Tax=Pseudoalteromonas phage Cr39582 TaxID=2099852 RepID=A0A2P1CKY6_9VIRU|nr:nicking at origin of replication [Pseudoalteromonas phage Cr39582]AVJ51870.1 putative replication initiation protein [Pseudoalteromonas phage Cr39582]